MLKRLIAVSIQLENFNETKIYKKSDLIYSQLFNIFNIIKLKILLQHWMIMNMFHSI